MNQADVELAKDLAGAGLVVTELHRTGAMGAALTPAHPGRFIVATQDAHGLPHVAIVNRGPGEHGEAFARLLTKHFGHGGF